MSNIRSRGNVTIPVAESKNSGFRRCRRLCPDGSICCLNNDVRHALCICKHPECDCHSADRYQQEKARKALG